MNVQRLRHRLFLSRCKEIEVRDMGLYHGSPVLGMEQIRRAGRLHPQEHGELPGEWFCTSINDNMLRSFSDGDGLTGMVFDPPPLRIIQLDDMFYALATLDKLGSDHFDKLEKREREERWAYLLQYVDYDGDLRMSEAEFMDLIPEWADGVTFPWWTPYVNSWNSECEVALNQQGCDKVWAHLSQVVVRDQWFEEPRKGWNRVKRLVSKMTTEELMYA